MVDPGKLTATEYAGIDFFVCFLWLYILISQEKMKANSAIHPHNPSNILSARARSV